jgi:cobaltochelatase CobS
LLGAITFQKMEDLQMSTSKIKPFNANTAAVTAVHVLSEAPAPGTPVGLTLEQVFGVKSQMTVQGFYPGHSLAPAKNPLYVWEPARVKDVMEWMAEPNPDPLWITGPTGSGKTEMAVQLAAGLNAPTVIVTGRRDAEPADVFGKIHLVNGSTKFLPGLLVQAYEAGWAIVIDEIDSFPPEVGLSLHRMLEKKSLVLEDGTVVTPAARTLIIATANTRGDGEGGDAYTGTSVFNLATLNRFEKWIVTYPSPEVEEKILTSHLPTLDQGAISAMVKTACDIRNSYQQGSCPGPISIRDLIRWGKKITLSAARTDVSPVFHAFDKSFGNGVDRHVRAMLHKLVQTHFNVPAPAAPQF